MTHNGSGQGASDPIAPVLTAPRRRVGAGGQLVGAIGLGCMGMSEMYGPINDAESTRVIHAALDAGVTLLDTADMYGSGHNEELVGRALRGRRNDAFVVTKFGIRRENGRRWNDSSPTYARAACEASLRRLGIDHIDLYLAHRINPEIPVEDTVGALAELVTEGKVRRIGLSEVSAATLRRAHAVHPIAAVESELSLWTRDMVADGVLAAARTLGVTTIAYSPLGRGFLTGTVRDLSALAADDFRQANPRFAEGGLDANLPLLAPIERSAGELGVPPAAVALAWLLGQGEDIIPIPGTKRLGYLAANIAAANLCLDPSRLAGLTEAFHVGDVVGERYPAATLPITRSLTREQAGREVMTRLGIDPDVLIAAYAPLDERFGHSVVEMVFGEFVSRPELDLRTRQLATIAVLTALGGGGGPAQGQDRSLTR